jgi:hypothetical protein
MDGNRHPLPPHPGTSCPLIYRVVLFVILEGDSAVALAVVAVLFVFWLSSFAEDEGSASVVLLLLLLLLIALPANPNLVISTEGRAPCR